MIKVKTSKYYQQIITAFVTSLLLAVGFGIVFKTFWTAIIIPVILAFYHNDINRTFYLIGDNRKKRFKTAKFVYCGDIDLIKRMAERSKNITEGRLSTARMSNRIYLFKEANKQDAQTIKMSLYIPDSINYSLILSKIIKNNEHVFTITYGEKSGVITELKS